MIDEFENLVHQAEKVTGINCKKYSLTFLKRRFIIRMNATGKKTYGEYERYLRMNPEEKHNLHAELTINVTNFFRDIDSWDFFKKELIPDLIKKKHKNIRIWCAGCSSGDEVYSVIISFYQALNDNLRDIKLVVNGVDLDPRIIKIAKTGVILDHHQKEISDETLKKYFEKRGGYYYVKDFIQRHADFKLGDILTTRIPKSYYDVIICRNTVIYFAVESKIKLYEKFFEALPLDGYLFLGKTENLFGPARELFSVVNAKQKVYQKKRLPTHEN